MELFALILIIVVIVKIVKKTKQRNRARARSGPAVIQTSYTQVTERNVKQQMQFIERYTRQLVKEENKLKKEDLKEKEKQRKQFELTEKARYQAMQADHDITHLRQQQKDLLKIADYYERIATDPDRGSKARQAAYIKLLAYNDKIRAIDRKIETATYNKEKSERVIVNATKESKPGK